jgi:hypothetical protein
MLCFSTSVCFLPGARMRMTNDLPNSLADLGIRINEIARTPAQ